MRRTPREPELDDARLALAAAFRSEKRGICREVNAPGSFRSQAHNERKRRNRQLARRALPRATRIVCPIHTQCDVSHITL